MRNRKVINENDVIVSMSMSVEGDEVFHLRFRLKSGDVVEILLSYYELRTLKRLLNSSNKLGVVNSEIEMDVEV